MSSTDMLEHLHDRGQIPDWAYYQQNGKSFEDNYRDILYKRQRRFQQEIEVEKGLENETESKLSQILDKKINDLLNSLQ